MTAIAIIPTPAPDLTGLTAVGALGGITLAWTIPNDELVFATQIWASQTNDRSTASQIAEVLGSTFLHSMPPGQTWYYWIKAVNIYGRSDGAWYPLTATPTSGDTGFKAPTASTSFAHSGSSVTNITNGYAADGSFAVVAPTSGVYSDVFYYDYDFSAVDPTATITGVDYSIKAKASSTTQVPFTIVTLCFDGSTFATYDGLVQSTISNAIFLTTSSTSYTLGHTPNISTDWGIIENTSTDGTLQFSAVDFVGNANFGLKLNQTYLEGTAPTFSYDFVGCKLYWVLGGGVIGQSTSATNSDLTITGDCNITGTTTLNGETDLNGDVNVNGSMSISNSLEVNDSLAINEGAIISGALFINGTTLFTAAVSFESDIDMTLGSGKLILSATNSATVGAVTINKISGRCNIASSGTSVVVTNSLVTTSSHVMACVSQNDTTAYVKNVVPASGSFTINLGAAATSQVSIDFVVFN